MKISYGAMYSLGESLGELSNVELPFKEGMKVVRFHKAIRDEISLVDGKRIEMLKKHSGNEMKDGQYVLPKPGEDGHEAFVADYNEIMLEVADVPYAKIDVESIEQKGPDIKPKLIALIQELNEQVDKEADAKKAEKEAAKKAEG